MNRLWLGVSLALLFAGIGYASHRALFLSRAEETVGEVVKLSASNDRCGGRRNRYDCTKFEAEVEFFINDNSYLLDVSAGQSRGHDQPLVFANYSRGSQVPIVYDPRHPETAFRNEFGDLWGGPIVTFVFQIVAFIAGYRKQR